MSFRQRTATGTVKQVDLGQEIVDQICEADPCQADLLTLRLVSRCFYPSATPFILPTIYTSFSEAHMLRISALLDRPHLLSNTKELVFDVRSPGPAYDIPLGSDSNPFIDTFSGAATNSTLGIMHRVRRARICIPDLSPDQIGTDKPCQLTEEQERSEFGKDVRYCEAQLRRIRLEGSVDHVTAVLDGFKELLQVLPGLRSLTIANKAHINPRARAVAEPGDDAGMKLFIDRVDPAIVTRVLSILQADGIRDSPELKDLSVYALTGKCGN